ncbi:sigma-70 family RNA polymerase sigma factor [Flagellimonas sp. CMM7]|uniref:sigma-70 family RNA polymerase sigma factor n=1 Tax=Flagellimonas sp. CMM7 TaxID=2654676 RepID=UPI0013D02878|nr:sigma-70 family RNA polymerase sigma factor [Flagellimonas sp. CMM7]UII80297.1 sigma-70 family RNA polymerase sigma factor [Flagellimonas sp. CMM7]
MNDTIELWFNTYSDDLFRWAYHKTSSKDTAEDLVQETFLAAVRAFDGYKKESSPKTWLFAILNNKIIDFYRKRAKAILINGEQAEQKFIDHTDSFFDSDKRWTLNNEAILWEEDTYILNNEEFRKVLKKCLGKLPEKWNFAITAKYLLDEPAKLICQELDITSSNYWQIVHRAKLMLKKCVDFNWKI